MTKLAAAAAFLTLNAYIYYFFATAPVIPPRTAFESFPQEFESGWSCRKQTEIAEDVVRNLGVTDYLLCDFAHPEHADYINVYVGYHQSQVREEGGGAGENSIHPPAHCLPGAGWDVIDNREMQLDFEGLPQSDATARRLVVARNNARALVYYWYQSRGHVISDDWKKILYVGWDRATRGRTDGSLVRFTIPMLNGDEESAERSFRALAPLVASRLRDHVPE